MVKRSGEVVRIHDEHELLPVASLVPYARNSRTHSDQQVAQIAASLQEFGFTNPVLVDEAGGIIAGHGRIMAAQSLGLERVPCLRLRGLSPSQTRAYVIADNTLALNAGWDAGLLAAEIRALGAAGFDLPLIGFDAAELESLLGNLPQEKPQKEGSGGIDYQEKFAVLVHCEDESDQERIFTALTGQGFSCKVLVN